MRILFYMDSLVRGGKERRLLQLIRYLNDRSAAEIELALMSREIAYKEFYTLNIRTNYLIRKSKKDLRVVRELYRICRNFNPHIIHVWDSMTAVYAVPVAKLVDAKLVNGMITDAPSNHGWRDTQFIRGKLTFPFSDVIVSNSLAGLQSYRAPRSRSVCIYSGFDLRRTAGLENPTTVRERLGIRTRNVVGMVGAFAERKDYRTFVLAAQMVLQKFSDVTFLGIGDGPMLDMTRSLVAEANKDKILFPGWQTHVENIINIFDIGVLSSSADGASNAVLEYMSLGKPVIATNCGGTPEIVVDGVTGLLVPEQSIDALAGAIERLLSHPEDGHTMGALGRKRLEEFFSLETMGAQYVRMYENVSSTR